MLYKQIRFINQLAHISRKFMLPGRQVMKNLIKARTNFLLYGAPSSGKTTLIQTLLNQTQTIFIEMNCALADRKYNFLILFQFQLYKKLGRSPKSIVKYSSNLQSIINDLRNQDQQVLNKMNGIYLFLDNIQQLRVSQKFLSSFYFACQNQFPFRMQFIFCGVNFGQKIYAIQQPFRTILSFCMPKPVKAFEEVIRNTICENIDKQLRKFEKYQIVQDERERMIKMLFATIHAAFQVLENNLSKIKSITKILILSIFGDISKKQNPYLKLKWLINTGNIRDYIQEVEQHGPIPQYQIQRKIQRTEENEVPIDLQMQYYPNLIMTSMHLADYSPESQDRRKFKDQRGISSKNIKQLEFKIMKHSLQRIISIGDALESQVKYHHKEQALKNHSLDYYACFSYLKEENKIKNIGKGNSFTTTKITGLAKEEEAKAFLKKIELQYTQFSS